MPNIEKRMDKMEKNVEYLVEKMDYLVIQIKLLLKLLVGEKKYLIMSKQRKYKHWNL